MPTEFEAKFYPIQKSVYRNTLKKAGAILHTPERQLKRVVFQKDDNPHIPCDYIRVRDEGDVIRLSLKTHAKEGGNLSEQKELDILVDDFDKTIEILKILGYIPSSYQETLRETWKLGNAEITIDSWPGLETYSEIEAPSEEEVKATAKLLNLDWDTKIITSVIEIYMKIYDMDRISVLKNLAHITFNDNPFIK